MRAVLQGLVAVLVVAALAVGGTAAVRPDLLDGGPLDGTALAAEVLPRGLTGVAPAKPPPPKGRVLPASTTKPLALDLGEPAPVGVAPIEDPLVQALAPRLQQAIVAAGPAGRSAVHVLDADGRTVIDVGATTPITPASTAKLVTAAVVLATFGPDRRFSTAVGATTPLQGGVVAGDLVLVGGGDPTLVSERWAAAQIDPERPATPLAVLADQVVAAGVTAVQGRVLADPGFLRGDPLAAGWPPRYLEELDATPITGLTVDGGLAIAEEDGRLRARAAADPALEAAAALTRALRERGVVVAGEAATAAEQRVGLAVELGRVESPPVLDLLRVVVQESDNHLADTLWRAAGRYGAGTGSFDDAGALLPTLLADLRLDWSTTVMADGSGLSRDSRIPPALLSTLNYRMTASPIGAAWQELMAVTGVSGTLERRLVGTIAELRVRGKTGSLGDVRAITGAVVGPDGRPLWFTVASDGLDDAQLASARRLQDLVVLELTAVLYGCTAVPPPPPTVPPAPGELPPLPTHTC